jgi:hypothetical protein
MTKQLSVIKLLNVTLLMNKTNYILQVYRFISQELYQKLDICNNKSIGLLWL